MCAGCMREHVPASRIHNVFVFCNRLNFAHTIQDSRSGVDGRVAQRANPHVTVHTAQLLSFTIARMDDIHTGGVPPLRSRQHKAQSPPSHGRPTIEISDVTNKQATPSPLSLSPYRIPVSLEGARRRPRVHTRIISGSAHVCAAAAQEARSPACHRPPPPYRTVLAPTSALPPSPPLANKENKTSHTHTPKATTPPPSILALNVASLFALSSLSSRLARRARLFY